MELKFDDEYLKQNNANNLAQSLSKPNDKLEQLRQLQRELANKNWNDDLDKKKPYEVPGASG